MKIFGKCVTVSSVIFIAGAHGDALPKNEELMINMFTNFEDSDDTGMNSVISTAEKVMAIYEEDPIKTRKIIQDVLEKIDNIRDVLVDDAKVELKKRTAWFQVVEVVESINSLSSNFIDKDTLQKIKKFAAPLKAESSKLELEKKYLDVFKKQISSLLMQVFAFFSSFSSHLKPSEGLHSAFMKIINKADIDEQPRESVFAESLPSVSDFNEMIEGFVNAAGEPEKLVEYTVQAADLDGKLEQDLFFKSLLLNKLSYFGSLLKQFVNNKTTTTTTTTSKK